MGRVKPNNREIPKELAILPMVSVVLFPYAIVQLLVRRERNLELLKGVGEQGIIGLFSPKDIKMAEAKPDDLYEYGVAARIVNKVELSEDTLQVVLQGLCRIRVRKYLQEEPYILAEVEEVKEVHESDLETRFLMDNLVELFNRFVTGNPRYSEEILRIVEMNLEEGPGVIADLVVSYINFRIEEKQKILEAIDIKVRLKKLIELLTKEIEFLKVESDIQSRAKQEMEKAQREYFLRRQLDEIRKELGEDEQVNTEFMELREKVKKMTFPKEIQETLDKEMSRLSRLPTAAADYHVIRSYIDWLVDLPWEKTTHDRLDMLEAKRILDQDHHGLKKVKERILEYLAVLKLKKDMKGPILCLVGPPGVGKTSLGQSMARALGRKFIRISIGGVRDEAEIRGHRRTYVGALPGRIIQGIKKVGTRNPLFMIDEIDKISAERGDPASALLEVLDPEQNNSFRDNYLELPFDLSQVMFVTTANLLDPVQPALKDRMEVITLPGYTLEEKEIIARDFLVSKQLKNHGLRRDQVTFSPEAVRKMIDSYTREAGVRNLDREIANICRKIARAVAEGAEPPFVIKTSSMDKYLGPPRYIMEEAIKEDEVGVAMGLAWTQTGGELLPIETTRIQGKEGIKLTGQLGEVMQESVQAAISYVQSKADKIGIPKGAFDKCLLHVHFPAGAVPKDGPSAGITVATAIASLMSRRPVRRDVAMTGEITLRGHILAVGGIKEKVLAAYRAGIKMIILPEKNKNDLIDIPKEVKRKIKFLFVSTADEAFKEALLDKVDTKKTEPVPSRQKRAHMSS